MATNTTPSIEQPQGQKTPPKDPSAEKQKLQSTPGNPHGSGSAAVSDGYKTLKVDEAKPGVTDDIERHQTCDFRAMLKTLLRRVANSNAPQDDEQLLEECLGRVLEIANESGPNSIRAGVQEYTSRKKPGSKPNTETAKLEVDYYAPFVSTFNTAFKKLGKLEFASLRAIDASEDLQVQFQRNDPKELTGNHGSLTSTRKPDAVLAAYGTARRASRDADDDTVLLRHDDITGRCATEPPRQSFSWEDILLCIEFKLGLHKAETIPQKYTTAFSNCSSKLEPRGDVEWNSDELDAAFASSSLLHPDDAQIGNKQTGSSNSGKSGVASRSSERIALQQASNSSNKRKSAEEQESSAPKKVRKDPEMPGPMVQCGLYGAEMLCRGPYATHAINLLVVKDQMWLWYYDRQGAIQTSGLNFVVDLPYFLVLLAIFQRFTLRDWGIETELMYQAVAHHRWREEPKLPYDQASFVFAFPENKKVKVIRKDPLYQRFSLLGRGTAVYCAEQVGGSFPANKKLAFKLSWPEKERESEVAILDKISELKDNCIVGHVPELLGSRDFEYSTQTIRDEIASHGKPLAGGGRRMAGPRILRVLLMRKLERVDELELEMFLRIWVDCYRCHFQLWLHGIEHSDISLHNIMYNPDDANKGVLNDFDLSRTRDKDESVGFATGKERTGTIPFMALDLLTDEYFSGKLIRLYRHDLESFVWILAYKLLKDGPHDRVVRAWQTGDHYLCRAKKSEFLRDYVGKYMPAIRSSMRKFADAVIIWFSLRLNEILQIQLSIQVMEDEDRKAEIKADDVATVDRWNGDTRVEAASYFFQELEKSFIRGLNALDIKPLFPSTQSSN